VHLGIVFSVQKDPWSFYSDNNNLLLLPGGKISYSSYVR
jgi:hypothetical protein